LKTTNAKGPPLSEPFTLVSRPRSGSNTPLTNLEGVDSRLQALGLVHGGGGITYSAKETDDA